MLFLSAEDYLVAYSIQIQEGSSDSISPLTGSQPAWWLVDIKQHSAAVAALVLHFFELSPGRLFFFFFFVSTLFHN